MVAIQSLFVAATTLFSITAKALHYTCESVPPLNFVGRDGAGTANWCGSQQNVCNELCGGNVQANECTGGDGGIPIDETEYCYDCVCGDGSIPSLRDYAGSIPGLICLREYQNCAQGSFGNYKDCKQQCGTGEVSSPGHLVAVPYSTVEPSATQTSSTETNAGVTATTTVLTITSPESGVETVTTFSTLNTASSVSLSSPSPSSFSTSSFSSPSSSASTEFPLASPAIPPASSSSTTTSSSGAGITTTFSGAGVKSTAAWANIAAAGLIGLFVAAW